MFTNNKIQKEENLIKNKSKEHLLVFNKKGKVLLRKKGTKDFISTSGTDINLFNGNLVTHNHPNGTPFSLTDICTTLSTYTKEAHVVTSNNITYVLSVIDDTVYDFIDFNILEEEFNTLFTFYHKKYILGGSIKKHNKNYQKAYSMVLKDLFEDIPEIDYYEIGEYKE